MLNKHSEDLFCGFAFLFMNLFVCEIQEAFLKVKYIYFLNQSKTQLINPVVKNKR